jgi:hypothetical protein
LEDILEDAPKIADKIGSPLLMGISKTYLNKQANNFSRRNSKLLNP